MTLRSALSFMVLLMSAGCGGVETQPLAGNNGGDGSGDAAGKAGSAASAGNQAAGSRAGAGNEKDADSDSSNVLDAPTNDVLGAVPCLTSNDSCPAGQYCDQQNGVFRCVAGCKTRAECNAGDSGITGTMDCCNHKCVDLFSDNAHCGGCGKACMNAATCCGGTCADTASDGMHCGGCFMPCKLPHAAKAKCMSGCRVDACEVGFGNCNMMDSDGCETQTNTLTSCGSCTGVCNPANVVGASCSTGSCTFAGCDTGFQDCDGTVPGMVPNGCESDKNTDNLHCGGCPGTNCTALGKTCIGGVCVGSTVNRLLVVAGNATGGYLTCVIAGLTPFYTVVDAVTVPTPTDLANHDGVLVYNNGDHTNPVALGDALADYFDTHGHVVEALYGTGGLGTMGGRWASGGYSLLAGSWTSASVSLGIINEPGSPLLANVTTLTATRSTTGSALNGGVIVATFNNGQPLVVRGVKNGRNRADIAIFPGGCSGSYWTGNGFELMRNAVNF